MACGGWSVKQNEGSRLLLEFDWTLIANSDHHPFYEQGIPVLMLHTGLHADYHRPGDTAEKINSQGMSEVDRLLFALVYELANRPEPPRFPPRPAARRKTPAAGSSAEPLAVLLDGTPLRLGIAWHVNDAEPDTIVVNQVAPDSPAARAGLQIGDRIYKNWRPALRRRRNVRPLGQEPARAHRVADRTGRAASGVDVAARGRDSARETRGVNMAETWQGPGIPTPGGRWRSQRTAGHCGWPMAARPSGRRAAA